MNASDIIRARQGQVVFVNMKNSIGGYIHPPNYSSYSQKSEIYTGQIGCGYINITETNMVSSPSICNPIITDNTLITSPATTATGYPLDDFSRQFILKNNVIMTSTQTICQPLQVDMPDIDNSCISCTTVSMISTQNICQPLTIDNTLTTNNCVNVLGYPINYNSINDIYKFNAVMISTISICEPIQCSVPDIYVNFKYPDDSILSMISTPAVCQSINVIMPTGIMTQNGMCSTICCFSTLSSCTGIF